MRGIVFYAASITAIVSALLCITRRSPVASALWLVNVLFNLSVVYVLLDAPFIAAVQILVYAGAIMVLFLFVIMLLNIGNLGASDMKGAAGKIIATLAGLVIIGEVIGLSSVDIQAGAGLPEGTISRMIDPGTGPTQAIQVIAQPLFSQYLVPFELTSVMLLAALVGAVVLAKRKI
jgi:NADH-quinone oxidoreductase subunit J